MSKTIKLKLKKLKIKEPCGSHLSKGSNGRSLNISTDMRIVADETYLKELSEDMRADRLAHDKRMQESMEFAKSFYT